MMRSLERRWKAGAHARAHFTGKQADNRQTYPLSEAKRFHELALRVLKSKRDCVDRGNRQSYLPPRAHEQGTAKLGLRQIISCREEITPGAFGPAARAIHRALL